MSNVTNVAATVEPLETGIESREQLAKTLCGCLADTYLLMIKTQAYHWNVVGPLFVSVHELTETHYQDLFKAADELAERVRALGYPAITSTEEMRTLSVVSEETGNPSAAEMLQTLVADHEKVARSFRRAAERAEDNRDIVTADMLTARIAFHEQAIWMLNALLSE